MVAVGDNVDTAPQAFAFASCAKVPKSQENIATFGAYHGYVSQTDIEIIATLSGRAVANGAWFFYERADPQTASEDQIEDEKELVRSVSGEG